MAISRSVSPTASPRPMEEVMPSLQLSVPGQETTSVISWAPASARPISLSSLHSFGRVDLGTQRNSRFCSVVVRTRLPA